MAYNQKHPLHNLTFSVKHVLIHLSTFENCFTKTSIFSFSVEKSKHLSEHGLTAYSKTGHQPPITVGYRN